MRALVRMIVMGVVPAVVLAVLAGGFVAWRTLAVDESRVSSAELRITTIEGSKADKDDLDALTKAQAKLWKENADLSRELNTIRVELAILRAKVETTH